MTGRQFTIFEALDIGMGASVDWTRYDAEEFGLRLGVELGHGP